MAQLNDAFFEQYNKIYHPTPAGVTPVEGAGIRKPEPAKHRFDGSRLLFGQGLQKLCFCGNPAIKGG